MGIYSDEIEDILVNTPMVQNPLFKYDNYTYHIQLFMVDKITQTEYSRTRWDAFNGYERGDATTVEASNIGKSSYGIDTSSESAKAAYDIIKDKKIIIAESGVTDTVSIKDLTIKSVPGFGDDKTYTASCEFKLKLLETAGNGLVNKIHLLSGMLGYESYLNTPLFISLWFTGYDNTNKEKPMPVITEVFSGIPEFVYQVIIESVDTNIDMNQTTYDMTLRPITDIGLVSTYTYMNNQEFGNWDRNLSFSQIVRRIIEKKNNELADAWKEFFLGMYPEGVALEYQFVIKDTDTSYYADMIRNSYLESDKTDLEKDLEFLNDWKQGVYKEKIENYAQQKATELLKKDYDNSFFKGGYFAKTYDQYKANNIHNYNGYVYDASMDNEYVKKYKLLVEKYKGHSVDKYIRNQNKDKYINRLINSVQKDMSTFDPNKAEYMWPGGSYKPDDNSNICSIISNIWKICCPKSDMMPTFTFTPTYAGDYKNRAYYRVVLNISFNKIPGLKEMLEGVRNNDYYEHSNQNQREYLNYCFANGALLKRYRYFLNGQDTSVLSYNTKEDLFWYLNAGNFEDLKAAEQTDGVNYTDLSSITENLEKARDYAVYVNDILQNKIDLIKQKNSSKDGRVFMEDLVQLINADAAMQMRGAMYTAAQYSDIKIKLQTEAGSEKKKDENSNDSKKKAQTNADINIAKIAAQNMLTHGQKLELKLKILGDPYWISFSTEDVQIIGRTMPHLIMCTKTFTRNNEWDQPIEDKMMEINTIYMITSITSTFSEGQFTQELEGYVPPPFVQQYIPDQDKGDRVVGVINNEQKQMSIPVYQDKDGNVYHVEDRKANVFEKKILNKDTIQEKKITKYANMSYPGDPEPTDV